MSPTHPPFRAPSAVVDSCCGLAPKQWFTITKCHTTRCDGQVDLDLVNEANGLAPTSCMTRGTNGADNFRPTEGSWSEYEMGKWVSDIICVRLRLRAKNTEYDIG